MRRATSAAAAGRPLLAFALVAGIALLLYVPTLMPDVGTWDTAEFQAIGPVLGIAHPTGYPTYTLLAWLASVVLQPVRQRGLPGQPPLGAADGRRSRAPRRPRRAGHTALAAGRPGRRRLRGDAHRLAPLDAGRRARAARLPGGAPAGAAGRLAAAPGSRRRAGRALAGRGGLRLRAVARQPRPDAAAGAGHRRLRAARGAAHPVAALAPGPGLPGCPGPDHRRRLRLPAPALGHGPTARLRRPRDLEGLLVRRPRPAVPGLRSVGCRRSRTS